MKKFILSALVAVAAISANAQAQKGDIQTSIDFKPFISTGDMFENAGVNVAYYLTNKDAIRVGLNFGSNKESENNIDVKKSNWAISLGYENHFKSYKNIDLYAGAEITYKSTSKKGTLTAFGETFNNAKLGGDNTFGIFAFTGINLYVYKQLYLGAEIQLGYSNTSDSKIDSAQQDANTGKVGLVSVDPKSSSSDFTISARPALRLGWTF